MNGRRTAALAVAAASIATTALIAPTAMGQHAAGHGDRVEGAGQGDRMDHADHAERMDHVSHRDHAVDGDSGPRPGAPAPPPPAALTGPEHAADAVYDPDDMAAARRQLNIEHGGLTTRMALADRFELVSSGGEEGYLWDLQGWYGGDLHKLAWKTQGHGEAGDGADAAEIQVLYSRAVTPFFDLQAGLRRDLEPGPDRSHAVIGVQGLLPHVLEIDAAAFLSDEGDWTARFEAEYDVRVSQRLVVQPRLELDFAAQTMPDLGMGAGLASAEAGIRLRYELRRELAPYVGIASERLLGRTADFARADGREPRSLSLVLGVRAWF